MEIPSRGLVFRTPKLHILVRQMTRHGERKQATGQTVICNFGCEVGSHVRRDEDELALLPLFKRRELV